VVTARTSGRTLRIFVLIERIYALTDTTFAATQGLSILRTEP
jgi:hypothetical protein